VHLPALRRSRPPYPETQQPTRKETAAMTPTSRGIAKPADHQDEDPAAAAARHLFEAELALHDAHQSHVQAWITAAGDKLHQAVLDHLAVTREQHQPDSSGS
jgi:hypothetical protein